MSPNIRQGCPRTKHLSRPSTSFVINRSKTWMPATSAGMTGGGSRFLVKTLADVGGALAGCHHQEAEVGLGGDKAHALLDEGVLACKVALTAKSCILAVRLGGRNHALDGDHDLGIAEGTGL